MYSLELYKDEAKKNNLLNLIIKVLVISSAPGLYAFKFNCPGKFQDGKDGEKNGRFTNPPTH